MGPGDLQEPLQQSKHLHWHKNLKGKRADGRIYDDSREFGPDVALTIIYLVRLA
jgi:hypothetical protein